MSKKRQAQKAEPFISEKAIIRGFSYEYEDHDAVPMHYHQEHQLVYAVSGVMTVRTEEQVFTIPPQKAIWIPAKTWHSNEISGHVSMRSLFVAHRLGSKVSKSSFVIEVSALLRELILETCRMENLLRENVFDSKMAAVILGVLKKSEKVDLQLPLPKDARALEASRIMLEEPGEEVKISELARRCGASLRTLERIFYSDTGMTIGRWRQQLRMFHAIQLIEEGMSVTDAAMDSGYNSPSAFIAMYKKKFGVTPAKGIGRYEQ